MAAAVNKPLLLLFYLCQRRKRKQKYRKSIGYGHISKPFCRFRRWLKLKRQSTHFPLLSCFYNWGLRYSKGPDISSLLLLTKLLHQNTSPCSMTLLTRWTIELNMARTWEKMSCDKIQGLQLVNFLRKRKRPRKSWNLFNFYVDACEHYARTTCVNSDLKTQRWKLDNVKSTQEFTRVKLYFYL